MTAIVYTDGTNTTTYNYNLMGSTITYEERTGDNACEMYYAYDNNGRLYGFYYDGASNDGFYYYQRNLQGDIVAILNSTGTTVVTYEYDSWGKLLSTTGTLASSVGADNPFRYRGYYYDDETELYYLNQRYYTPEWGRFINADDYMGQTGALLSHNVFAYCGNNPVMFSDPSGRCFSCCMVGRDLHGDEPEEPENDDSLDELQRMLDEYLQENMPSYIPGSLELLSEDIIEGFVSYNDYMSLVEDFLRFWNPGFLVDFILLMQPKYPDQDGIKLQVKLKFTWGSDYGRLYVYEDGKIELYLSNDAFYFD